MRRMGLAETIKKEYEFFKIYPDEYSKKVKSISYLLVQKGKNEFMSDQSPVYIFGNVESAPFILFGINPGYSDLNNPIEEKVARMSWESYVNLYRNFFTFFNEKGFRSPYYTSLGYLIGGLVSIFGGTPLSNRWELFQKYIANIELIPYHSRGISLPSNLKENQLVYLKNRFIENLDFLAQYSHKLLIFNGSPWYNLLIRNNLIRNVEKASITDSFNLYFFTFHNVPAVLFDKFFQRHFWGITNYHRKTIIPQTIAKKYPTINLG